MKGKLQSSMTPPFGPGFYILFHLQRFNNLDMFYLLFGTNDSVGQLSQWHSKGLIIMRCLTGVLDFSRVFPRVYDTNMLVSKTRVKTQEKRKKNPNREPNARKCFYITLCIG